MGCQLDLSHLVCPAPLNLWSCLRNTRVSQALHLFTEAFTGSSPAADWKRPPVHLQKNWLQRFAIGHIASKNDDDYDDVERRRRFFPSAPASSQV